MKKKLVLILILIMAIMEIINAQYLTEKRIKVNNEEIAYLDSEIGDTTLLFIHGAFINKEYWMGQLSYFAPHYRVVAMDLAGHGNSTNNRYTWTIEEYGKDINDMIHALSVKNIILIGHSLGSDIMIEAVAQNKNNVIGIIGIDHFKNLNFEMPQEMLDALSQGLKNDFANTCEYYVSTQMMSAQTEKSLTSRIVTAFREMNPTVGAPLTENQLKYSKREKEVLKNLPLKLNLINISYTPTDEDALKQILGINYTLSIMKGSCHYPMLENPEEVNFQLEKILSAISN